MDSASKNSQFCIPKALRFPIAVDNILRRRLTFKRELLQQSNLLPIRVAILGGSTTGEIRKALELFLLGYGLQPTFYESAYDRYEEEVLYENPDLWNFKPEVVLVHTTWVNVSEFPDLMEVESRVEERVRREMARFEGLWNKIHRELGALIIQNNFDMAPLRLLGNLEAYESYGRVNFLMRLNAEFAGYARQHPNLLINDILYLSAQVGLDNWFDTNYWYSFHMAVTPRASVALAHNVAGIVKSVYGRSKKCLVLDLDNTVWGGVIGDDGVQGLLLGRDHPVGEAFADFQRYVKKLRQRGVVLAVCSKNDLENAKEGFSHPDSILRLEDFSAFKANWDPKPDNIVAIAAELNVGLDSLVFVDDNPVERALVSERLPEVSVPEVGSDVSLFASVLEQERYFEVHKLVPDDLGRAAYYMTNAERRACQSEFSDYNEFLASLEMTATIEAFRPVYYDRITQLANKTNQFNLTTRRFTGAEIESIACDPNYLTLYGRLVDRFGDNGLVSIVIGAVRDDTVELQTWLMSCRVLKREMELAMFDTLIEQCQALGIKTVVGAYIPSKKNGMVADHYRDLGFIRAEPSEGRELWRFDVPAEYTPRARNIRRSAETIAAFEA
jgi:FkbH-like protein